MKSTKDSFIAILTLLILASMSLPGLAQKKQDAPPIPKPGALVWPAPPEQPRVSYQGMIVDDDDFKEKKKLSFLDRLMGETPEQDRTTLSRPYGVAVGEDDRIYVADSARREIVIFDRRNRSIAAWRGNSQIPLSLPVGVALDGSSRLFVSDSREAQVVVFDPDGSPVQSLGANLMERPVGLAVDNRLQRLYVGDLGLNKILVYDLRTLKIQGQIGGEGGKGDPEPDALSAPANLAVDRDGNLYVSDTMQCRVIVFNSEGNFVRYFGRRGDIQGEFARPKGIAVDSEGHVYVADAAFGNIQIFNPDGRLLLAVSSGGEDPGYLSLPTGLAIDSQDRIYVTEHWTMAKGRLQIFQYMPEQKNLLVADRAKEIR